jgi:hypothetical protein
MGVFLFRMSNFEFIPHNPKGDKVGYSQPRPTSCLLILDSYIFPQKGDKVRCFKPIYPIDQSINQSIYLSSHTIYKIRRRSQNPGQQKKGGIASTLSVISLTIPVILQE